jgi:glycerate kinase
VNRPSATGRPLRVVVAPDSFKGTLDAAAAAEALAEGWARARPNDEIVTVPLADGGEGTLEALGAGLPSPCLRTAVVTGPGGEPVEAGWLLRPDGTAVVELATAAGLPQLDPLDPLGATTFGVGELLRIAAADPATTRVLLGLGGSATTDGGSGALAALGTRFVDADGVGLPRGGGALSRLAAIDLTGLVAAPANGLECLVDVTNPLVGERGAAAVFGPQKGATAEDVAALDAALGHFADVLARVAPHPMDRFTPGAGAAGGTAFGLLSCWPGRMVPGSRAVAEAAGLAAALADADVAITGEGRFDDQSLHGKVVGNLLEMATGSGTVVAVAAGSVTAAPRPPAVAAVSLTSLAGSPQASMAEPARWLVAAGETLANDRTLLDAVAAPTAN